MKKLLGLVALVVLMACGDSDQSADKKQENKNSTQLGSAGFTAAFAQLMNNYYHLKDAFVLSNDSLIGKSAALLLRDADSLNLTSFQADSAVMQTALVYQQSISADAAAIIAEKNIDERRKSFSTISENLYELIRVVRYQKEKVYQLHCPMAFDNAGANWLNNSANIKNPYFGIKMLSCGSVKDSLDFRSY